MKKTSIMVAAVRLCSDCHPPIDFRHFQIVSWLIIDNMNSKKHKIKWLQIRHLEVVWNLIQFGRSASKPILERLLRHYMDNGRLTWVSWQTKWGARRPQSLTNTWKFACHFSSLTAARKTCCHQSLRHRQRQTSEQWGLSWLQHGTS